MNKIYTSDNYIIVDIDGDINAFPKNKSDYEEEDDTFILRRPNRRIQVFPFNDIENWFDEEGLVNYTKETLRSFLRQNTGFSTASGSSDADIENLKNAEIQKGTILFSDTQYTNENRLSGQSGVLLTLPNNKGIVSNKSAPPSAVDWVNNLGELVPETSDADTYLARITFEIDPTLNNRNLRMYLDIGDTEMIDILGETKRLARGAGNDTSIKFEFQYFTENLFLQNNGKIILDVDGDFEIYDIVYLISRIKKVNP